jgi:hypothetical protein
MASTGPKISSFPYGHRGISEENSRLDVKSFGAVVRALAAADQSCSLRFCSFDVSHHLGVLVTVHQRAHVSSSSGRGVSRISTSNNAARSNSLLYASWRDAASAAAAASISGIIAGWSLAADGAGERAAGSISST